MKPYYLYKIENKVNGKLYIGVTKDFDKRMKQHINSRKSQRSLLNKAILKYGQENFVFKVICIGYESYIYDLEVKAISKYNTLAKGGHGYNISVGGKGGEGTKIQKRADDKPIYVKGFWFPNKRTCLEKMRVTSSTLHQRLVRGTAGDLQWLRPTSVLNRAVYVAGFWFKDIYHASYILKISKDKINSRINIGAVEQFVGEPGRPKQEISVEGVIYESLKEASLYSGYTRKMLYRRLKNDPDNFYLTKG